MSKTTLVIMAVAGLVFAIASSALFPSTLAVEKVNLGETVGSLLLGVIAAVLAGRVLLGRGSATSVSRITVPLLSAVAYAVLSSATSSLLIATHIADTLNKTSESPHAAFYLALVIGLVAYLAAATMYGFAGTRQGVNVGARTGLLVLLLLAVIPGLNVLGMIGFLITALVREPRIVPESEPAPSAG